MKLELFKTCKAFNDAINRDFSERIQQTKPKTREWYLLFHEIKQRHYLFLTGETDVNGIHCYTAKESLEQRKLLHKLFAEHMSEMTENPAIGRWLLKLNDWRNLIWEMYDRIDNGYHNKILWAFSCAAYVTYVSYYHELFINSYGESEGEDMYKRMCAKLKPCFKQSRPYWSIPKEIVQNSTADE